MLRRRAWRIGCLRVGRRVPPGHGDTRWLSGTEARAPPPVLLPSAHVHLLRFFQLHPYGSTLKIPKRRASACHPISNRDSNSSARPSCAHASGWQRSLIAIIQKTRNPHDDATQPIREPTRNPGQPTAVVHQCHDPDPKITPTVAIPAISTSFPLLLGARVASEGWPALPVGRGHLRLDKLNTPEARRLRFFVINALDAT